MPDAPEMPSSANCAQLPVNSGFVGSKVLCASSTYLMVVTHHRSNPGHGLTSRGPLVLPSTWILALGLLGQRNAARSYDAGGSPDVLALEIQQQHTDFAISA